jgi:hypothetical protein
LSADHRSLLFDSKREGGQGGFDLWTSRRVRKTPLAREGWTPLFDSQSLAGWKRFQELRGKWNVEQGLLVGSGDFTYLVSDKEFADFHLRADVLINAPSDAGIYFRSGPTLIPNGAGGFLPGYEAQLGENGEHGTGDLAVETGRSVEGAPGWIVLQKSHSVAGGVPGHTLRPPCDQWFELEILARGDELEIKVDGQTTARHRDMDRRYQRGHIALQVFNPGTVVKFRTIEIKELAGNTLDLGQVPALRELVAARERSRDAVKVQFDEGKAAAQELTAAEAELLEARIRLAETEGSPAEVVSLLKELVAKRTEHRGLVQARVDAGIEVPAVLSPVDGQIADAKARLAKAEAAALK